MSIDDVVQYLVKSDFADLPPMVLHETKRSLLNIWGLSMNAASGPLTAPFMRLYKTSGHSSNSMASVVGWKEPMSLQWAAFANGYTAHVQDFDDTHLDTIIHPTASVYPVSLAFCESRGLSGKHMLLAMALAAELQIRVGMALGKSHFERGWHVTATTGTYGGIVAGGKLCGLDSAQFKNAIGLAGSMAAGTMHALGTMAKAFHPGKAAYNSILAILLVKSGFNSSLDGFEGRRSFFAIASEGPQTSLITEGLGEKWHMQDNQYKRYPCGVVSHPAILCAERLSNQIRGNVHDISRVEVGVNPVVLDVMGKTIPTTELEAKFSVFHLVALALCAGTVTVQGLSSSIYDETIISLRKKIEVRVDSTISNDCAQVIVYDTRQHLYEVSISNSGPLFPATVHRLTDGEIEQKFYSLCDGRVHPQYAKQIAESIWNLENAESLAPLMHLSTKNLLSQNK